MNQKETDYRKQKIKSRFAWGVAVFFALFWLFVALVPFAFMILNSFRKQFDMLSQGVFHLPDPWFFDNYPNIIKNGEGCALTGNLPLASRIIEACKRSGKVVTVKCRPGMRPGNVVIRAFARMCEDSGADMITVHGRTRNMMYEGEPVYEYIAEAKQAVHIPVIANGGIASEEDAVRMMQEVDQHA